MLDMPPPLCIERIRPTGASHQGGIRAMNPAQWLTTAGRYETCAEPDAHHEESSLTNGSEQPTGPRAVNDSQNTTPLYLLPPAREFIVDALESLDIEIHRML